MNQGEEEFDDLPITAISRYSTEGNLTGSWRTQRPFFVERIPPCRDACPLSQNIPEYLNLLRQGKLKEAWQFLIRNNPLPLSTARVCQAFCEKACNRGKFCDEEGKCDEPVSVNAIERFLGELALKEGWSPPSAEPRISEGEKVAVIGAGPAGLSCAYQLERQGCNVQIFEALSVPGGLMRVAIPETRLARDILILEISKHILELPRVNIQYNCRVDKKKFAEIRKDFDAVFVAVGCHRPKKLKKLSIPGRDAEGVIYGLDFLKRVNLGQTPEIGREVAIIGDGNTAIDSAHCARLLGKKVFVLCQKAREDIPDFLQKGVEAAEKEGVVFIFSVKILEIIFENGKLKGIRYARAECQTIDDEEVALCGNVIIALGEEPDLSFIDEDFSPAISGIFIGGDAATQASNVAAAIASGKEAAEKIIYFLNGETQLTQQEEESKQVVEFKDLNTDYVEPQPRHKKIKDGQTVIKEAERCFSCGTCMSCQNCYNFCPDVAVFKREDGKMFINYDYCKGCLICQQECPCGVIGSELETKAIERGKKE